MKLCKHQEAEVDFSKALESDGELLGLAKADPTC